ncbi:ATpase, histidine kinase-, DNA gyrase B-, and HSP90-like domain containing protein [Clostridium aceticum]|uniref:histidine kinase n=1 Tax=Clostridium aceticum TaxID=84022 RepID=A0A0G3W6X8_9CLOT|nr:HAMP domain-containing sensor histidine kinase [Clostridium aceticum]AKL94093.1 ATpase, histidine kinase-, DNA gyrase B-, and HSP90-like domain containing protein [Clostridium aceticum]
MILTKEMIEDNEKIFFELQNKETRNMLSFLNMMEEFVIIIDPDNQEIVFANDYAKNEILFLETYPCWEALGYDRPCCKNNTCLSEKTFEIKKSDGTWKQHRVTKIILSNKVLLMESIIDITEKKVKEKKKKLKYNLLSMVSHELRTLLNIILSTLQLLEGYDENWKNSSNYKHTQRIKKATGQINKLLRDILLVEKVEADRVRFNPKSIDVIKLTKAILEPIRESISLFSNIIFITEKETFVTNVDEFLLSTILTNLLTNAVKYSKANKDIIVKIEFEEENVLFKIIDQGIGIPKAEQKNLFQSFYRASNVGDISGTGLGLTIVQDFVDIHQGSISFKSEVDKGTTFIVKIPIIR